MANAKLDIDEEIKRLEELHDRGLARQVAEFVQCEARLTDATSALETHEGTKQQLLLNRQQAERDEDALRQTTESKKDGIRECRNRIRDLQTRQGVSQLAYPSNMESLRGTLSNDEGFAEQPLGPIGDHVQLTSPIWSQFIEKSLGSTLNGFIVTSKQDQVRLLATMHAVNW